ncbi:hypothetical protein [Actinocorallia sp. A-T 12471]|uniref:hypothetical protein n=1 Tax=Actinocorallia sp. A-T 12471 TaxID=3089813 RepID=UPI0029CBB209|nr:hypothetical protein [Actinocorallia sp. A-T 12471]MDX6742634.1 hypothetical protein [Actinocorallia sp. A-T 12471]
MTDDVETFVEQLQSQVLRRFSELVAAELNASRYTRHAARALDERRLSARQLIHRLGLSERRFLAELRRDLHATIGDAQYATALSLLARDQFAPLVRDWLTGEPPAPALAERGVTWTIGRQAAPLTAVSLLTLLHYPPARRPATRSEAV